MITKKIARIYRRRKAVSPVIAAILLIALTVAAVAIVYFLIIPSFRTYKLEATIISVNDTNKDSLYNQITMQFANTGTKTVEIYNVTIWVCSAGDQGNVDLWIPLLDWNFSNPNDASIDPSEIDSDVKINGDQQIGLTIVEDTYCRVEFMYHGGRQPLLLNWFRLNDYWDEADILIDFNNLDLTAGGFDGTIDDPGRVANNYVTSGGDYYLNESSYYNFLPVLDEVDVQFYVGSQIMVMHSVNGNLTGQPLVQSIDLTTSLFRSRKFYLLGLAGSWGDEFPSAAWAVKVTITYTDNSTNEWELGHDYIDDWWYGANPGNVCISAPSGKVTEIDLGLQTDTPHSHIHTHTTKFSIDFYKYVKSITFTDPGTDASGAHIISITFR